MAKRGRPNKYDSIDLKQIGRLSLLGLTDKELADFLGIAESTLNKWKIEHPEFMETLKAGKDDADAKVARSLYNNAINGNVTAQIYWLKNRHPKKWRDKPGEEKHDSTIETVDFYFEEINES